MIPKTIHYVWLGGGEIPQDLRRYIKTWDILKKQGFEIVQWSEDNLSLDDIPESIKIAMQLKKYAFVADYFRLKILFERGGVYFDTDIEVKKDITELLDTRVLLGFIYDASIGTAVIGAEKNNPLIGDILQLYKNSQWRFDKDNNVFLLTFDMFPDKVIANNNDLFTAFFLKNIPGFRLDGSGQHLDGMSIYPKEYLEGYTFDKRHNFTIHHCFGSWTRNKKIETVKYKMKVFLEKFYFIWTIRDMHYRKKKNMNLPFTAEYLKQKGSYYKN